MLQITLRKNKKKLISKSLKPQNKLSSETKLRFTEVMRIMAKGKIEVSEFALGLVKIWRIQGPLNIIFK